MQFIIKVMYLNQANLIGNLTKDPEMKEVASGGFVCVFPIATNRFYKDSTGEKKQDTQFIDIVCFGKQAESSGQFLQKGSQVFITGRIQTRSWEVEGEKRFRTEVVAERVSFGNKIKKEEEDLTDKEE